LARHDSKHGEHESDQLCLTSHSTPDRRPLMRPHNQRSVKNAKSPPSTINGITYIMTTRAGFHKFTSFDQYPAAFNAAIQSIGKNFYVTRSFSRETVGSSEYWCLLARPVDDFSVHLNADRELMFLFSKYETFEIRTLEAYDIFYDHLEKSRIDKSIRFLISNDQNI
jgi:hypothetical protein